MTTHDITDLAARIEQSGPAAPPPAAPRPESRLGAERPEVTVEDPGKYLSLGDGPAAPALAATRSGWTGPRDYVESYAIGAARNAVRNAHKRPAWHAIGEPEEMAKSWQDVLDAHAAVTVALAAIPQAMGKAAADSAAALEHADEPVALPSVADARRWAERKAFEAIAVCRSTRAKYDEIVVSHREQHAAKLAASVPAEADEIRAAVDGLRARVERLRAGVDAVVEVALADDPGAAGRSTGRPTDLGILDDLEQELRVLADVAATPTEPRLTPSMGERRMIAHEMTQTAGLTQAALDLARTEHAEGYRFTAFTRGIPAHVIENAAARAVTMSRGF